MKKVFTFIIAILLLGSCKPCDECSTKYKVTLKTCDGNTIQEYYPDDIYLSGDNITITVKGKKKYLIGGIVIVERL
jgi:hypothetical protein